MKACECRGCTSPDPQNEGWCVSEQMKRYSYELHLASGAVLTGMTPPTRQSVEEIATGFYGLAPTTLNAVFIFPS